MPTKTHYIFAILLALIVGSVFTYTVYPIYQREHLFKTTATQLQQGQVETVAYKLRDYQIAQRGFENTDIRIRYYGLFIELATIYHRQGNEEMRDASLELVLNGLDKVSYNLTNTELHIYGFYLGKHADQIFENSSFTFRYLMDNYAWMIRTNHPYDFEILLNHLDIYWDMIKNHREKYADYFYMSYHKVLFRNKYKYLDPLTQLTDSEITRIQSRMDEMKKIMLTNNWTDKQIATEIYKLENGIGKYSSTEFPQFDLLPR